MIKFEHTETYGWKSAIHGMRNPMNSWDKSDSILKLEGSNWEERDKWHFSVEIGEKDLTLMKQLIKAGTDHSKFMRMITVTCDITAPRYWWTEFDTYKVGTVRNSCSTMHTIHKKEFELDDFSFEFVQEFEFVPYFDFATVVISELNTMRALYLKTKDKAYWYAMIQILPNSYNQHATVQMNYAVLRNIYHARKNHKLDEWKKFCKWIESLPYSELITEEE